MLEDRAFDEKNTIGERIRMIRGACSQQEFATIYSIHKNTLFRIEKGESEPNYSFLQQLVVTTGVSPDWLLLGWGDMLLGEYVDTIGSMIEGEAKGLGVSISPDMNEHITWLAEVVIRKKIRSLIQEIHSDQ